MDCGVEGAAYANGGAGAPMPPAGILGGTGGVGGNERSPGRAGLRVAFQEKGEVKEKREKFLTAKYGSHQMSLIRKRLAVEMWLYEELKKLYEAKGKLMAGQQTNMMLQQIASTQLASVNTEEVEVDIDELLDMDNDEERRRHLQNLLIDAKGPQTDIKKFINDLLEKAKTL